MLGGELRTLAAAAPAVNAKVVELTGLSWDHFIQCVVLPQGGFAKFLHAEPRQRQDLLVSLLGLKVYERVMNRANLLAKERQATAAALSGELDRYTDATDDAVRVAEARVEVLRDLPLLVAQRATELAAATEAAQRLEEQVAAIASRLTALAEVHEPPGLNELASRRADLVTAQQDAESALETALVAQDSADQAAAAAGDPRELQTLIEAHDRLSGLRATRPTLEQDRSRAAAAAREAGVVLDEVRRRRTATEAARDAVLTANAADAVARVLVVGQDCPVCRQPVAQIPDRSAHATLDEADGLLRVAQDEENAAQETARRSQRAADQTELRLAQLDEQEQQAQESVAGQPAREEAATAHVRATEARTAALAATAAVRRTRDDQQAARAAATASDEEWRGLAAAFQTARDPFVGDGAPRATGDSAADRAALAEWASHRGDELTDRQARTERDHKAAVLERDSARAAVRVVFADHELDPPKDLGQAVVAAHRAADRAETDAARLRERRDTAVRIRVDIAAAQADAVLHHDLAQLLRRPLLRALAGGGGPGRAGDRGIGRALRACPAASSSWPWPRSRSIVVDHNDASLRRPVSTLSGGETFQASLAMALAMSAQIAGLSAVLQSPAWRRSCSTRASAPSTRPAWTSWRRPWSGSPRAETGW